VVRVDESVIEEFLDCIDDVGSDPRTCYEMYREFDDGTLKKILECVEKCRCEDDFEEGILVPVGVSKEYDKFCRENCMCIDW